MGLQNTLNIRKYLKSLPQNIIKFQLPAAMCGSVWPPTSLKSLTRITLLIFIQLWAREHTKWAWASLCAKHKDTFGDEWCSVKEAHELVWRVYRQQNWDYLRLKKKNNCNGLKHTIYKSIFFPQFSSSKDYQELKLNKLNFFLSLIAARESTAYTRRRGVRGQWRWQPRKRVLERTYCVTWVLVQ